MAMRQAAFLAGACGISFRIDGDRTIRINPATIVYNHLNQPRELVQGAPVNALFA